MLAKLLSLLLHAKSGAISAVFLLGATGALVSVSASNNGVTTITITEPSASPSASASASPASATTHNETAEPSESPEPSSSPSSTTPACSDEAKALALQVQRVDAAYTGFHTNLTNLRGLRDAKTLETANAMLQLIRESATKAIHGTATAACLKDEDQNEDATNDQGEQGDNTGDHQNGDSPKTTTTTATPTPSPVVDTTKTNTDSDNEGSDHKVGPTFTGTATAIADQAIAAMQVAFDAANNSPVTTPKPTPTHKVESSRSPKPSESPEPKDHS
jgi:hypothetical protein